MPTPPTTKFSRQQIVGLQYDLAVAAVRIFNLVCLMLLIGHLNGCLQFMVPMLNDFPHDSWIMIDNLRVRCDVIIA